MNNIFTVDCHYLDRQQFAAAYLVVDGDEAAFVDNNTNRAVPRLLATLAETGLSPEQVRWLIVTHVHLDHSGGTSALAQACPNATVLAHPRAARHIIEPAKLVASASAVYGEAEFQRLYGDIVPVPEGRVRIMEDNESVDLGRRRLTFLHTRGHANHHFCIAESGSQAVFTGDAFGLHYPSLQRDGAFAFPSTSPTDFEPELARQSIRRLLALQPSSAYVTHFGEVTDLQTTGHQLLRHLDFAESLLDAAEASDLPDDGLTAFAQQRCEDYFRGLLDGRGGQSRDPEAWGLIELDIGLNAQGIAFAATKRRRKAAS